MIFQNHVILKTTIKVLMIHDQLLGYPNLSLRLRESNDCNKRLNFKS